MKPVRHKTAKRRKRKILLAVAALLLVVAAALAAAFFIAGPENIINMIRMTGDDRLPQSDGKSGVEFYENGNLGYVFRYPRAWNLETNETQDQVSHTLSAPGYTEKSTGKKLEINIVRFGDYPIAGSGGSRRPYSFLIPTCPEKQQEGSLLIDGKSYVRCRTGSNPVSYRVGFTKYEMYFEFNYTYLSRDSQETKIIESIIEGFRVVPRPDDDMKAFNLGEIFTLAVNESARLAGENLIITSKKIEEFSQTIGDTGEGRNVLALTFESSNGSVMTTMTHQVDKSHYSEPLATFRWGGYTIKAIRFAAPYGPLEMEVSK